MDHLGRDFVEVGPFLFDRAQKCLFKLHDRLPPEQIKLTDTSVSLLDELVKGNGQPVSHEHLLLNIWNRAGGISRLHMGICRLKDGLGQEGDRLILAEKHAYRLAVAPRFPVRQDYVGRDDHIRQFIDLYDRLRNGEGLTVILVRGEDGIGKTSLVKHFFSLLKLRSLGTTGILDGCGGSTMNSDDGYLPWKSALADLSANDGSGVAKQPVDDVLKSFSAVTLQSTLRHLSRVRPVTLFLDDMHWDKGTSFGLIDYISAQCATCEIMLFIAVQPSAMTSKDAWQTIERLGARHGPFWEARLTGLTLQSVDHYLDIHYGPNDFPPQLGEQLYRRRCNKPRVLVNLLRKLEMRVHPLIAIESGRWHLTLPWEQFLAQVPDSEDELIHEELRGLTEMGLQILRLGALLGEKFPLGPVAMAAGFPAAECDRLIRQVLGQGLLIQGGSVIELPRIGTTWEIQFLQGVRRSILNDREFSPGRRAAAAKSLAATMQSLFQGRAASIAFQLASLLEQAGQFTPAISYFALAADRESKTLAHEDAAQICEHAIGLIDNCAGDFDDPEKELHILQTWGIALMSSKGFACPQLGPIYLRAEKLCRAKWTDKTRLVSALFGKWVFAIDHGRIRDARTVAEEMHSIVADHLTGPAREAMLIEAEFARGVSYLQLGFVEDAIQCLHMASSNAKPEHAEFNPFFVLLDPAVKARSHYTRCLWFAGQADKALETMIAATSLAETLHHPESLIYSYVFLADIYQFCGDVDACLEWSNKAIKLANENRVAQERAWAELINSWAKAEKYGGLEVFEEFERRVAEYKETLHCHVALTKFYCLMAEVANGYAEVSLATKFLTAAQEEQKRTEEGYFDSEIIRLQTELALRLKEIDLPQAQTQLDLVLDSCRKRGAHALEWKGMISSARVQASLGNQEVAVVTLAKVRDDAHTLGSAWAVRRANECQAELGLS
jgi:tetratricopeptide (TPR) repeat protein